jgi:phosphatidylinositol glycan class V
MYFRYTESLFALFTLYGLYVHFCKENTFWNGILSATSFALATSVRSNGIITIGFFLFEMIQRRRKCNLFQTCLQCGIVLLPYILFQAYGYLLYCVNGPRSPWCKSMIPHLYSYVQKAYWYSFIH